MPALLVVAIVVVALLLALVGGAVAAGVWARRMQRENATATVERLGADRVLLVDETARLLGLASEQPAAGAAWGCLAVTADEVLFVQWKPKREVRIERSRLKSVEAPSLPIGRKGPVQLLALRYASAHDSIEAVAFHVSELPRWLSELAPSVNKGFPPKPVPVPVPEPASPSTRPKPKGPASHKPSKKRR